jgi:hypothetical protein
VLRIDPLLVNMGSGQNWPVAFGSRCAWKSNANPT